MNYSLNDLPVAAINMIFAGLAELPYKDSHQLIAHLGGQIRMQDEARETASEPSAAGQREQARENAGVQGEPTGLTVDC